MTDDLRTAKASLMEILAMAEGLQVPFLRGNRMTILISATPVHDGLDDIVYVQNAEQVLRNNGWVRACEANTEGVTRLLNGLRSTIASTAR